MANQESNGFRYFVLGAIAGVVGGLLVARKPGTEFREDLAEYGERSKGLARRFIERLPFRVKASAAAGAVRGAASEAYEEARERV